MDMVKLHSMDDFLSLPETAWKIKQPAEGDKREDAMETGTQPFQNPYHFNIKSNQTSAMQGNKPYLLKHYCGLLISVLSNGGIKL